MKEIVMKAIDKARKLVGLPCRECGGKGYVVDRDVAAFIEHNGLALFQAADTLMINEIEYGSLGSISVGTWEDLGLSEDQAELFATDVGHAHKIHSCPTCKGQQNHPDPLGAATAIIKSLRAADRKRYAEWIGKQTPESRRRKRLRGMAVAIRYAQQKTTHDLGEAE